MIGEVKNSKVARVRVGYDGRVHKWYRGPLAKERFENEVRVLNYLEEQGCDFVPKVLEEDAEQLYLVTSNCGGRAGNLSSAKQDRIFQQLEKFGVRHDDQADRNITYNPQMGRFCVIDFEFSEITATGEGVTREDAEQEAHRMRREESGPKKSDEEVDQND